MKVREMLASPLLAGLAVRQRLSPSPAGAFRILLFHDIPEVHQQTFADLIERIVKNNGFITPAEAAARIEGSSRSNDRHVPCLVSFDDGFASNRWAAERVLARFGVKALFFVCPGLIDLPPRERPAEVARGIFRARIAENAPAAQRPLMSWDDIGELAAAGHEIGAHSQTHRCLAALDPAALEHEVTGACERLTTVLGRHPAWFAWPFGDVDSIDEAGLATIARRVRFCRSGVRGLNRSGQHRLAIFAEHVDLSASALWQELAVRGGLDTRYREARRRILQLAEAADQVQALP